MPLTAGLNFVFGATSHYWAHLFLWTLNGFVQGMGYGPCTRGLSHCRSVKERGANLLASGTSRTTWAGASRASWRPSPPSIGAAVVPGVIAAAVRVLPVRGRATPQAEGLPPAGNTKGLSAREREDHEKELSARELCSNTSCRTRCCGCC